MDKKPPRPLLGPSPVLAPPKAEKAFQAVLEKIPLERQVALLRALLQQEPGDEPPPPKGKKR